MDILIKNLSYKGFSQNCMTLSDDVSQALLRVAAGL